MSIITPALLIACGGHPDGARTYAGPLAVACDARGIPDSALVPFLANLLNESAALTHVVEDTYYTQAAHIRATWPSKFPTVASAQPYVCNAQALADRIYNGWQGRGLPQLTGYPNCLAYSVATGVPVSKIAAYLLTPLGAADSAAWYCVYRGCLPFAVRGDLLGVTQRWEGKGVIGWDHVQTWAGQVARAIKGLQLVIPPAPAPVVNIASARPQPEADALTDKFNPPEGTA